ncbi:hypothetical protein ACFQSB_39720, partial [Sphaerisporangium rhizosphaerae]
ALEDPPPPEAPLSVEEGFTPERGDGAKPPTEFWEPDPEADDPESRIRWGRVALVTVVSVASAGVVWSLIFAPAARTGGPVDVEAAGGTVVITAGESLPPLVDSPPPPPPGGTAAPGSSPNATGPAANRPGVAVPTSSVPVVPPPTSSRPTASPTKTKNKTSSPTTNDGPNNPPPPPKTTSSPKPSQKSTPKQSSSSQPQTKQTTQAPPPPPPPPAFTASTTSMDVGSSRDGTVTVRSQVGSITWEAVGRDILVSPGSGSTGSGQTASIGFSVRGSGSCGQQQEAYMSIKWSGDNQGTKGSGTIGVNITYTKPC